MCAFRSGRLIVGGDLPVIGQRSLPDVAAFRAVHVQHRSGFIVRQVVGTPLSFFAGRTSVG